MNINSSKIEGEACAHTIVVGRRPWGLRCSAERLWEFGALVGVCSTGRPYEESRVVLLDQPRCQSGWALTLDHFSDDSK